jgi:hypothetical protein
MGGKHSSHYDYDAHAQSVDVKDVTSHEYNATVLQRLRDNDPGLTRIKILDENDVNMSHNFTVREGDDLGWLGYFIGNNTQLHELSIQYLPQDVKRIDALIRGVENNKSIEILEMNMTSIAIFSKSPFRSLGRLLKNDNLRHICFRQIDLMDSINLQCARNIVLMLDQPNQRNAVKNLKFIGGFSDESVVKIAAALRSHAQLENLIITNELSSEYFLGISGCVALANKLMFLQSLKTITLTHNDIGDDGVSSLVPGLASLRSLEKLNLRGNSIGDLGFQALVEGMSNCCSLTTLDLSHNRSITVSGLRSLATLFRSDSSSLIEVSLYGIHVGDEGAVALADGLKGNKTLKNLGFNCYPFSSYHNGRHLVIATGLTSAGWSAFSKLLCDTSTVNTTYLSNHTLEAIGTYAGAPDDVKHYLALNKHVADDEVAIQKIVESHPDFNVESMFQWKLKLLPHVMSTLGRVGSSRVFYDDCFDTLITEEKSVEAFRSMKLSTVYKFVRGMPVEVDDYRVGNDATIVASPRKRKIDQLSR